MSNIIITVHVLLIDLLILLFLYKIEIIYHEIELWSFVCRDFEHIIIIYYVLYS